MQISCIIYSLIYRAKEAILQHAPQKAEGIAYDVQEILDSMKPLVAFDMGLDSKMN